MVSVCIWLKGTFIDLHIICSHEHEVLKVSYCDRSVSVVHRRASSIARHQQFALKSYSSYTPGSLDSKLGRKHCRSKIAKIVPLEIQDGCHGGHLENQFFASSSELEGELTRNLLGSIGLTYRSKIAKIFLIRNPRCLPWQPSLKIYFSLLLLNRKAY